jgi:transposase
VSKRPAYGQASVARTWAILNVAARHQLTNISNRELAAEVGVSLRTIEYCLAQLRRQGAIALEYDATRARTIRLT